MPDERAKRVAIDALDPLQPEATLASSWLLSGRHDRAADDCVEGETEQRHVRVA
jgi:hypothetical protein